VLSFLYKTPYANEVGKGKLHDDFEVEESVFAEKIIDNNEIDVHGYNDVQNVLQRAEQKIKMLEKKIQQLEKRLPVEFQEVNFLNYQNKKRILVSVKIL
jgi:hypothetical protein